MTTTPDRSTPAAQRLDGIVGVALTAQAVALNDDEEGLESHLGAGDPDLVGFAVEGAAMGLTMLDHRAPRDTARVDQFLERWDRFRSIVYAGMGLGLAEVKAPVLEAAQARGDLDAYFAINGYAFHLVLFAPQEYLDGRPLPDDLSPLGSVFDQGLARAAWFTAAADGAAVAAIIASFPPDRRDDVWTGVGLAATYAGGLDPEGLRRLADGAGDHGAALAAGSAMAAHLRVAGGNLGPDHEAACEALSGWPAAKADELVRSAKAAAPDDSLSAFKGWHHEIRGAFAGG